MRISRTISSWAIVLAFAAPPLLAQQVRPVPPRVTQDIDGTKLVILRGNTHPLARAEYDQGAAPQDLPMERILLLLSRSPVQEAALQQLLEEQQDPGSVNYHRWLTPEQFGDQFGPAPEDIEKITGWLKSQGFRVDRVANGRGVVEFSGTAAQVERGFHTSIHSYFVNGEQHWANARDPQIPAALSPVVAGIVSLHSFPVKTTHHSAGAFRKDPGDSAWVPASPSPEFAVSINNTTYYAVAPYDFATIYNVLPLWNAGVDGTGVSIAIPARSNITPQDVRNFRSAFGLPADDPTITVNPPDPGLTSDKFEFEATLDVEWAGAVARGATITLVVTEATAATDGVILSAEYIVNNNLAQVLSYSYETCEVASSQFYSPWWEQAAAEGITVVVAAGDGGSGVCDQFQDFAQQGLQVNGIASTPYDVAVGGTDFSDYLNGSIGTYWNSSNNSGTLASAKSYIPEMTWNSSCASPQLVQLLGASSEEALCNNSAEESLLDVEGGSGGVSSFYAKPWWQSGVSGIPADGKRDVPDVSLFAGSGTMDHLYPYCQSDKGFTCSPSGPGEIVAGGAGGTSLAAPAFAGIMALIDQKTGARQGMANPVLYKLAATQYGSASSPNTANLQACNSSAPLASSSSCVFHDVTIGTIDVPCLAGTPNCFVSNPSDTYGLLSTSGTSLVPAYSAGAGYDLATGLGSVNVANLVNQWSAAATNTLPMFATSVPSNCQPPTSSSQFSNNVPQINAWVQFTSAQIGDIVEWDWYDPNSVKQLTQTTTTTFAGNGCAWDPINISGNAYASKLGRWYVNYLYNGSFQGRNSFVLTGMIATTTTVAASPSSIATTGSTTLTAAVTAVSGSGTPTGTIAFDLGSTVLGSATLTGSGGTAQATLAVTGSQLALGSNNITANYSGDANYNGSTASVTVTVTSSSTTAPDLVVTSLTGPTNGNPGGTINVSATVLNQGSSSAGAFRVEYYFSPSSSFSLSTAIDTTWGCSITSLASGTSHICSGSIAVPASLTSGTWYLAVLADSGNQVVESNENNNWRIADTGPVTLGAVLKILGAGSDGRLYSIVPTTGATTLIGPLPTVMTDIAAYNGSLYGISYTTPSVLYGINPNTGAGAAIGSGTGATLLDALVFSPSGTLYGAGADSLYTINTSTGTATLVGSGSGVGTYSSSGDLEFDATGKLYLTSVGFSGDQLFSLDPATGQGTSIGSIGFYGVLGLAYYSGIAYGFTSGGQVITINLSTGAGTAIASYTPGFEGATAFAPAGTSPPVLSISKTHTGNFRQGQTGATYTVTVSNSASAGPTTGMVTVVETAPAGLTLVSMTGTGWMCASNSCTRSDALAAGSSYPSITVTVNVASNAPAQVTNQATVSGSGSASATANDVTNVNTAPVPALSISKTHTGNFTQGQTTATYTVTVSNGASAGPTTGTVTVSETAPVGLTLASMAGTGWTCAATSCTRSDALAAGASYPAITVTVNVASNAPSQVTNQVTVSGGGSASATASDITSITAVSTKIATTTTMAANPGTIASTASTTLTATVTAASGSVTPTGTVSFDLGNTVLGSATLTGTGGTAHATLVVNGSQLAVGSNTITANYSGDGNCNGSTASVTVTVTSSSTASSSYIISTVAGGAYGFGGDGGAATSAELRGPGGVAVDGAGNLLISDWGNNRIRKVTPAGVISTVVGNGTQGFSGDGGPAISAELDWPDGVAVGGSGDIFIEDGANNRIRKVTPAGTISTVAGNGTFGFSGDGGQATSAELNGTVGVAVDAAGNLYLADLMNYRVRKVTPAGTITTVAGTGTQGFSGDGGPATSAELNQPAGVAVDSAGNLFIADNGNNRIRKVTPAGTITTVAGNGVQGYSGDGGSATSAELNSPEGIDVDSTGNLLISDFGNIRIRKVTPAGSISTVAGNGIQGFSGDGGPATSAELYWPSDVAVDGAGDIFIADSGNNCIRKLTPATSSQPSLTISKAHSGSFAQGQTGATYTVMVGNVASAGPTSGTVTVTENPPTGLTVASMTGSGWSCSGTTCTRSDVLNPGSSYPAITVTVNVASNAPSQVTNQVTVSGGGSALATANDVTNVNTASVTALSISKTHTGNFSQGQTGATYTVMVSNGASAGPSTGTVTVTETAPVGLTLVSMSGTGWTCASNTCTRSDALAAGASYPAITVTVNVASNAPTQVTNQVTVSGGGSASATANDVTSITAVSTKIATTTTVAASPSAIASTASTTLTATVTAASGSGTPTGTVLFDLGSTVLVGSTVLGSATLTGSGETAQAALTLNGGQFSLGSNSITANYGGDGNYNGSAASVTVTVTSPLSGYTISTVAGGGSQGLGDGGPATSADLGEPYGVAVDGAGNIFIADYLNNRIRKVTPAGTISTVAGGGTQGLGDGGPATLAELNGPESVAVDGAGNMYIADLGNSRVRKVTPAGTISTVAGNGTAGFSGDGGPATSAELNQPASVAVDGAGDFFIADQNNSRIRKVTPAGTISTVAGNGTAGFSGDGGPAVSAELNGPSGVAVDGAGDLFIADSVNNRIRKVTSVGTISTVAGNGAYGFSGDGGPATSAELFAPGGVARDGAGNLFIADGGTNRIRKVTPAGTISTVAGNGNRGFNGDGGPATSAELNLPNGVAADTSGNIFIADTYNNRVRKLTPATSLQPNLTISKTHTWDDPMVLEKTYTVTVGNVASAGPTGGTVTVTENPPSGLIVFSMTGSGWSCSGTTCTRSDVLNPGSSYPTITVAVGVAYDAPSQVTNQVTVSGGGSASATANDVTNITSPAPSINSGGALNAASYASNAVAPGSIAAVFGSFPVTSPAMASGAPWPTSLGGLSVQFGATQAPLYYASGSQTNLQVPWELSGQTQTTISAAANGQTGAAQTVSLATYAPGIFSMNGQGTGQGAIVDAISGRLLDSSNPAIAGSTYVSIYCTGLGPVTNQPASGAASPSNPLAKTTTTPIVGIGNIGAQVLFSGLAPGFVGEYQVNALVPAGVTPGNSVPVSISIGGVYSNTVTIAVQAAASNPQPSIANLSPPSAQAGSGPMPLAINGSGFIASSSVTVNGVSHAATFVNANQLTITLTASDLATAGTLSVVVTNPAPGGGSSSSAAFTVQPAATPTLIGLLLNPSTLTAGASTTGTVTLSGAAPSGGIQVSISSSNSSAQVPASVTVAAGQSSATFTIATTSVTSAQIATITAKLGTSQFSVNLTVNPASTSIPLQGKSFTINGTITMSGQQLSFEITTICGSYCTTELDDVSALANIWFAADFDSGTSVSGNTAVYSGSSNTGYYSDTNIDYGAPITITSTTLTITFTSSAAGSAVSGSVSFATSSGPIQGTFTGTLAAPGLW